MASAGPGAFGNVQLLGNHWSGPPDGDTDAVAAAAIAAVEKLNAATAWPRTTVTAATLVLPERRDRSREWEPVPRVPFTGNGVCVRR